MVWKNKIGESRGLVSQQLDGLSKVISNLASEINVEIRFKSDLENKIHVALERTGIKLNEIIVYENKWGKLEVNIFHKGCGGKRACISILEKVISETIGRKMVKEENDCCNKGKNSSCAIKLVEEEVFKVATGVAKLTKYGGMISGDSYTFLSTGEGKYIVALSDGMGSGQRASVQSRATVSLLEQFMESGFDKDTTIKIINSILVLKSSEECFSTIDLSIIDLYEGDVEFVKIGAAPTLIKKPERVEVIKSASLPAGILGTIETELAHGKVESGDFIIMASDGIIDSFNTEDGESITGFREFVEDFDSLNPQQIADSILAKAYDNCNEKPVDDMLVLVAKVWKRAG
jgi:stage II sporulation protein E